jgi:hypothetical protein
MSIEMASLEIAPTPSGPSVASTQTSTHPTIYPTSAIRRKPRITYQSPSAHNPPSLRVEAPTDEFLRALAAKVGSTSSSPDDTPAETQTQRKKVKKVLDGKVEKKPAHRLRYLMGPPLPLYHPLGRLALSLPELDPASLGLPPLPVEDNSRRSSARTRRPAAKLREADEECLSTVSATPAAVSTETKEKASPKKKGGARPGAGMKRKRKDADEDATYPAKKTRNPRGAAAALARAATSEAPSPPEAATPATPESAVEAPEEKKPERRSTRSRGTLLRRDSSASEATATSVSVSANAKTKSMDATDLKTPSTEGGRAGNEEGHAEGAQGKSEGHDKDLKKN